jgi:hypothetical protein
MNARTVADVWREYKEGIAGGLAVEKLELEWQARWRPEPKQRAAWRRRKVIVDEVLHLIYTGLSPIAAVVELEAQRGSQSLPKLHDSLLALQKQRRSIQERPRTLDWGCAFTLCRQCIALYLLVFHYYIV